MRCHQGVDERAKMGCIAQQGGDPIGQHADARLANDEAEALQQASHLVLQIAT